MKIIFEKEQKLLNEIVKNNPEWGEKLKTAVEGIFTHLPEKLMPDYDEKLVAEFLKELMASSAKLGQEQYLAAVTEDNTYHAMWKKCLGSKNLPLDLYRALGSAGLTELVMETLKKMTTNKFNEDNINNLVELIKLRNHLRQVEQRFLKKSFIAYLKKQISLYDK